MWNEHGLVGEGGVLQASCNPSAIMSPTVDGDKLKVYPVCPQPVTEVDQPECWLVKPQRRCPGILNIHSEEGRQREDRNKDQTESEQRRRTLWGEARGCDCDHVSTKMWGYVRHT